MGAVPTINTTLGACEGLDVVVAMVVSPRPERAGQADQDGRPSGAARPDWFEAERQQRAARPPELAAIESAVAVILAKRAAVELTLYETPSPAARGSVGRS